MRFSAKARSKLSQIGSVLPVVSAGRKARVQAQREHIVAGEDGLPVLVSAPTLLDRLLARSQGRVLPTPPDSAKKRRGRPSKGQKNAPAVRQHPGAVGADGRLQPSLDDNGGAV